MESILHPTLKELVSLGYTDLSLIDEAQFRALLHDIDVAVVVHDADTKIISCNAVAQDLLGLSQEQMLNKASADIDWHFVCEDGSPLALQKLPVNMVLSSKKSLQGYVVGVTKPEEKKTVWLSVNAIPIFDDSDAIIRIIISFTNITERKRAEQQLAASEQLFRTLVENSPDHIARYDLNLRRVYLNPALQSQFEIPVEKAIGETPKVSSPLNNPDRYMNNIRRVIDTGEECTDEISYRTPNQGIRWASARFAPEFDSKGKVQSVIVISNDITEKIVAEKERAENIKLLESLNRISRILQGEGNIEVILKQTLDEVRSIFVCDRAYLLYPCDPSTPEVEVPFESADTDYPGAKSRGSKLSVDDALSLFMRRVLEQDGPCKLGADGEYPVADYYQQEFRIRSVLAMALRPSVDSAWQFGIHQCSYERYWTDHEIRLFQEIGRQISIGLNNLLIARNLRNSEERLRLVFDSSPVSIQEEDYSAVKHYLDSLRNEYEDDLGGYLARHPEVVDKCSDLVRLVDFNSAALVLHEAESKQELIRRLDETTIDETKVTFPKVLCSLMRGENSFHLETELRTLNGREYPVNAFFSVSPGYEQDLGKILVSLIDISEQKQAEKERKQLLLFFESLDRVNQVLKSEGEIEEILSRTLDVMLDIFDCDRAYLLYPCDPDAKGEWRVPIQRCRPDYPDPIPPGEALPDHPHIVASMRAMLQSDEPVPFASNTNLPIPPEIKESIGVLSMLAMAVYPNVDRPWQIGIQQCSYEREWTYQEIRLFREIGRRLSDGLNSLLITRDLRESEARFRLVFESSPVPSWEGDFSELKPILDNLKIEHGDHLGVYLRDHPELVERYAELVRIVDVNNAALALHRADSKEMLIENLAQTFVPESYDAFRYELEAISSGNTSFSFDAAVQTLNGQRKDVTVLFSVCPGYEHSLEKVIVSLLDITERKLAEHDRQFHLYFLESMDRINRVLHEDGNMEQVLQRTLNEVRSILNCDRCYLLYPCDPSSPSYTIPIESAAQEYPGANIQGVEVPTDEFLSQVMQASLDADHPVRLGKGCEYEISELLQEEFSVRSFMVMAIHPRVDVPWQLGIHQCSHERVWTDQETRLFEEVGRRLTDGLNSLLVTRNLRESEERYHLFFDNSPLPIRQEDFSAVKSYLDGLKPEYDNDLYGYLSDHPEVLRECANLVCVNDANQTAVEFHEADNKQMLLESYQKMFVKESFAAFKQVVVALMQGQTGFHQEAEIQTMNGRRQNVSGYFSVNPGFEHSLKEVLVSLVDITERKQYEDDLRLASSVFTNSHEGIMVSDASNRIIDINPAFSRITGYKREEVIGRNPKILSSGKNSNELYADMWGSITEVGEWQGEVLNKRKSGEEYVELLSIVAVKDYEGHLQHYLGAFSDITLLKEHEADLDRIAHYDILTSVPNRRLLDDRLEQAIATARRRNTNLAVCYLDLDGFKPINDEHGHEAGDAVLVEIASRLQRMLRAADTIARLGGDEFVLLWNDVGNKEDCIKALERVLDTVSKPIQLGDEEVTVSASIGVTLYPDDDVDADSLLRHADHAMYSAKQYGKNCYQMFDTKLERQISAKVDFLSKIKRALEEEEFELYYQPKVDYFANSVQGVEALLRWNDPILGLVGPKEFLPLIENDNLAYDVGRWVMEKAVQQAYSWNEIGINLPISINVFPRHIKYRTFAQDLGNAINTKWPDMPRGRLQMEIVESSALEDLDLIEGVIEECSEMGVKFSLDDFGTGYSSLVYLRRLTIDELKIDQSFVRDMLNDPNDQAIVISVIGLGEAFGLRVVAEGVETTQHAWHLMDLGCRVVQGFALGRPMPADELERWYAEFLTTGVKMYR